MSDYTPEIKTAKVKRTGEVVNVFLERYKTNPYYIVGKFPDHYWWDELEFIN